MKNLRIVPLCILLILSIGFLLPGCAHLQPGADPLIVRTEQLQTVATSSFDLVLQTDQLDRGFWSTKAPAFHNFCEWLRQPQSVPGLANPLQRDLAMLWNLDQVKLAYKSSKVSSNALLEAIATVESAANQAAAWITITTNKPPTL